MQYLRQPPGITGVFLAIVIQLLAYAAAGHASDAVSIEQLQQQAEAIRNDETLVEQTRNELLKQVQEAQSALEQEADFNVKAAQLQNEIDNAPQKAAAFRQRLEDAQRSPPDLSKLADPNLPPEELQARLTLLQAEQTALTERRSELLKGIENAPAHREEMQQRLTDLHARIEQFSTGLVAEGESLAQRTSELVARAHNQALQAEKSSLEVEILSDSALSEAVEAERAWTSYALQSNEAKLGAVKRALETARAEANERQLEATAALQEEIRSRAPVLRDIARDNRKLASRLQDIASQQDIARDEAEKIRQQLEATEQDAHLMQRRLDAAGRKDVLGRVMVTRLDNLPNTDVIRRDIKKRNEKIASASLDHIDIEEEFRALSQNRQYLSSLLPDFDSLDSGSQELLANLVRQREELLRENLRALGDLLRLLLDTNTNAQELISVTEEFHGFLVGNLLWVRNFSFLKLDGLSHQINAVLSPADWLALPHQFVSGMLAEGLSALVLIMLALALVLRWRFRAPYTQLMREPITLSGASLLNILWGFAYSIILVLPAPLLLYSCAHFLTTSGHSTDFSDAVAGALKFLSISLLLLLLTRITANRMGVGRRFLKWNARMLDAVRRELNWAGPTVLLAIALNRFAYELDVASQGGPLGELTTTVIAGTIIAFCYRLLKLGMFRDEKRLRITLRAVQAVAGLVIFMQLIGFLFAAEMYLFALLRSIVLLLLIKVVSDILERWLLILRAGLARKTREEQSLQNQPESASKEEALEDQVDVISLSEAHTKLLSLARLVTTATVLWIIWSPSLPAFNLLDSFTLWHVADPGSPENAARAITLFDLVLGLIVLVITGLITRHLPSLAEVFMREWFNMSAGARYASSILMQYLVIAIGGFMFLTIVGWEWSKVQWLVAALGVGIGFGLQEIVANFISGIIILFERPVRVGDIISVGGAEGTVKKINPRATIIETFDRKEHLVPNKELITGPVVNWSLSENAVRVIIPVGIAYGSDVRLALSLLLDAAREVERVLVEPEPRATFEDFGDNALLLWLRCYVAEDRPGVWTELRNCINDKFHEAGIVIAYPQRDIHLDTGEPLQIELLGPSPSAS